MSDPTMIGVRSNWDTRRSRHYHSSSSTSTPVLVDWAPSIET